jgi:hypothetical protein
MGKPTNPKRFISFALAFSLAFPANVFAANGGAARPRPAPGANLEIGQPIPDVKTPAGNSVYRAGDNNRIMAIEYGELIEGRLENGRPVWDRALPTKVEGIEQYRPSRLHRLFNWNSNSSNEIREELRAIESGESRKTTWGEKAKGAGTYLGGGAAFFFMALGLVAAVEVLMFHSNNPMALKNYTETLTDPVGWAALFGFMIAAFPFFKSAYKPINKPAHRFLPRFGAGLIVGGIASQVISEMGRDPLVRSCMMLDKIQMISEGGQPARDISACDLAFQKWTAPHMAEKLSPYIATLLVAGTMYFGITSGATFLLSKFNVPAMIKGIRMPKLTAIRGGNLASTVVMQVGHLMIFMASFQIARNVLGIEKWVREKFLTTFSFKRNQAGSTIKESMNNLAFTMVQLDKQKFKDADLVATAIVLQKHLGNQLHEWRQLQLQSVREAADQWARKLADFNTHLNKSYELYEDVIKRVAFERANPGTPANDPSRLSIDYLANDVYPSGYNGPFEDREEWEFVSSPNMLEYFLASMACGPDVEFETVENPWSITKGVKRWWNNDKPQVGSVLKDSTGFAVDFHPPQITAFNREETVCNQQMLGSKVKFPATKYPVYAVVTGPDGKDIQVQEKNMLEFVRKNIRPSILGPNNENRFDGWWAKNVLSQIQPAYDRYEQEYKKVLNGPLRAALTDKDYECIGGMDLSAPVAAGALSILTGFAQQDRCGGKTSRSLARGVINSLQDEIAVSLKLIRAIPKSDFEKDKLVTFEDRLQKIERMMGASLANLPDAIGTQVDLNTMKNEYLELRKQIEDTIPRPAADATAAKTPADNATVDQTAAAAAAEKAKNEFYNKHPYLVLLVNNLRQLDSAYEQVRVLYAYSSFPDRAGPAFLPPAQ